MLANPCESCGLDELKSENEDKCDEDQSDKDESAGEGLAVLCLAVVGASFDPAFAKPSVDFRQEVFGSLNGLSFAELAQHIDGLAEKLDFELALFAFAEMSLQGFTLCAIQVAFQVLTPQVFFLVWVEMSGHRMYCSIRFFSILRPRCILDLTVPKAKFVISAISS